MSITSQITIQDIRASIRKYNKFVDDTNQRRNYMCVGKCIGAIGIWCYRQFAAEYLPSVAVVCLHSAGNYNSVY